MTEPLNVTINRHDEYHAFIMANNTSSRTFIEIYIGSNDSMRGRPLLIVTSNDLNFTYQIRTLELCGIHVTLLTITFDERTCDEFLARASNTTTSDNGNPLIGIRFKYQNNYSTLSFIELISRPPTTSTIDIPSISTSVTTCDATRLDCYITTMALSFFFYFFLLLF